ncbi:putative retrotransposon gag domain-containing protein [Helianthus annuus]|nr:putative retrotransposon gag domain-containing protein [Helianthus annuus]
MENRKRTNAEFQQDTEARFAQHDAMFEKILSEMQSLHVSLQGLRDNNSIGSSSGGGKPITNTHKPYLKLAFPRYNGEDPAGWLYQAEQYFAFQQVADDDKVHLASFHLDGIALQWHRWLEKSKGPMSWVEFSKAVHSRFGPTDFEDPAEALTRLEQVTTVVAYQQEFERLSHRVDGLPESFLVGCFMGGLKDEIRLEVKLKSPRSLSDTIGMARLVEERLKLVQSPNLVETPLGGPLLNPTSGILGSTPTNKLSSPAPSQVRRLTSAEIRDRFPF